LLQPQSPNQYPFLKALKILLDVARGVLYLHTRNPPIVHRDIKSLNVLVTLDDKGLVADFGLTKIKTHGFLSTYCGSPAWTAPEVLRHEQYGEPADVYRYADPI
jgi:serine/threonine protein kinase